MLSRTAENLFWMARSMERAENTARMLDVSFRMSLLPSTIDKQARADARSSPLHSVEPLARGGVSSLRCHIMVKTARAASARVEFAFQMPSLASYLRRGTESPQGKGHQTTRLIGARPIHWPSRSKEGSRCDSFRSSLQRSWSARLWLTPRCYQPTTPRPFAPMSRVARRGKS